MERNMEGELIITKAITLSHVRGTTATRTFRLDEGTIILVTGNIRTHVRAFSRTVSNQKTMTVQFPGHKDGAISGHWVKEVNRLPKEPVTMECGIHFDDLSGDEIQVILGFCGGILEGLHKCWNPWYSGVIRQHPINRRDGMRYYMVEGIIQNAENMNDHIMKQHMVHIRKTMGRGIMLVSELETDMSGGMFTMGAETLEETEHCLANELLCLNKIQEYKVIEFNPHYLNPSTGNRMEPTE